MQAPHHRASEVAGGQRADDYLRLSHRFQPWSDIHVVDHQ